MSHLLAGGEVGFVAVRDLERESIASSMADDDTNAGVNRSRALRPSQSLLPPLLSPHLLAGRELGFAVSTEEIPDDPTLGVRLFWGTLGYHRVEAGTLKEFVYTEKEEESCKYLPEEIIGGIILQLPTKSLLRFRRVSKQWCSLISSNIKQKVRQKVIFPYRKPCHRADWCSCKYARRSCALKGYRPFRSIDQHLSQIENIDVVVGKSDVSPCQVNAHICGSCNGLLLVKIGTLLLLWDPSNGCRKRIICYQRLRNYPCDTHDGKYFEIQPHVQLGLCYDSHSNDYKVLLALEELQGRDRCTEVMVGSFKTRSWKHVKNLFSVTFEISCVVVNDNLHWLVYDNKHQREIILCFDPKKDQFVDLPTLLPPPRDDGQSRYLHVLGVGALDGCLCIAHWESTHKRELDSYDKNVTVEVSAMKQYGMGESWTRLFSFILRATYHRVVPLFFTDDLKRQVLMQMGDRFVAYDIDKDMHNVIAYISSATDDVAIVYEEKTLERCKPKTFMMSLESLSQNTKEVDAMAKQVHELSTMPEQVWKAPPLCQSWENKVNCALPKRIWELIAKGDQWYY